MSSNVIEGPDSMTSFSIVLAKAESTFLKVVGSCPLVLALLEGRALAQQNKTKLYLIHEKYN